MAFTPLKPEVIAAGAVGILERLILLPALVERMGGDEFKGAKNDTVTKRIPARTTARQKELRATGAARVVQTDDLAESSIDIKLTDHVYHATDCTDENLTLDIVNFADQILVPQVRAVVEKLELHVLDTIQGATYVPNLNVVNWTEADEDEPTHAWQTIVKTRRVLNEAHVRRENRIILAGTQAEQRFLLDTKLKPGPNPTGWGNETLQNASLGQVGGFTIVPCDLLGDDEAYAFTPDAFVLATMAPLIPESIKFGRTAGSDGFGLRWFRDYDSTVLSDRSLVDAYVGTKSVEDGKVPAGVAGTAAGTAYNARAVKIVLD